MAEPSPAPHGAERRHHTLVGDVHLLLVNSTGEMLFGQPQNAGFEDGAWHLPSGHVEAGESAVAALIREAREEIGVTIDEQAVEFCHVSTTRLGLAGGLLLRRSQLDGGT